MYVCVYVCMYVCMIYGIAIGVGSPPTRAVLFIKVMGLYTVLMATPIYVCIG